MPGLMVAAANRDLRSERKLCSILVTQQGVSPRWKGIEMRQYKAIWCSAALVGLCGTSHAYLLEQQAYSYSIGYTIGDPTGHFQVFQPFEVTAQWNVDTIGIDGFLVNDPANSGAFVRLLRDDGFGQPDETTNLGQKRFDLSPTGGSQHWVDRPFNVVLDPGRYWIRVSPGNNTYWGAIYNSNVGQHGFSRSSEGQVFNNDFATVLRIDGTAVPEPATWMLFGAGLLVLMRRRR
jgi:hypothetical protein